MRRKDREITDINKIFEIVDKCNICRIAMIDGDEPYIVPMNFGFSQKEMCLYFHCAREGRKIDILQVNPKVCFQMDTDYSLIVTEIAVECTSNFNCIMGTGNIEFIENRDEKIFALDKLMEKDTKKPSWDYPEEMLNMVCVFKLKIDKISCKSKI